MLFWILDDLELLMIHLHYRALNQRIMELESEIDDLTNQEKAKMDETEGTLHKKYSEHL